MKNKFFNFKNKKAQVTIFIIASVILVAGIIAFFMFRNSISVSQIPKDIEPVYSSFLYCLEQETFVGINLLESQGGYIYLPDFEPASRYMPFSSQFNFLGNPIPYWYYISGNNIQREQIPSENEMEEELEIFLNNEIRNCVFDSFYEQGFVINQGEPDAKINIRDNEVEVNLDMDLSISKEDESTLLNNHRIVVKSGLGELYDSAKKIYEYEQQDLFLENYALDTLRLYAPVDGVELSCSPVVWDADEVFDDLQNAIEVNTLSLKTKGGDYTLKSEENKYFILDINLDNEIKFLNSKDWPYSFEVAPSEGNILLASPVGNQQGLGMLGFCYSPYHFVYNLKYPVLVQVIKGEEIFQFPLAVVIQGNKPRESLKANAGNLNAPELCENANTFLSVNLYDSYLNKIQGNISYECLGETCNLGETYEGTLEKEFPQCNNGYILVKSKGFKDMKYLHSTIEQGNVDIILDRIYEKELKLNLDGKDYDKNAIITFISEDNSKSFVYPEQKEIELSEGQYDIEVYIYSDSDVKLKSQVYEQCVDVPQSGFGGLLGLTNQRCFDVEVPEQIISSALSGGGKESYYILESELENSQLIEINAESLDVPKNIKDLQENYLLFEDKELEVNFI